MNDKFVFLDLETTGLDSYNDLILEVGIIVADRDLEIIETFEQVIKQNTHSLKMSSHVRKMHESNFLINECEISSKTKEEVEKNAIMFLSNLGIPKNTYPLSGSSISFDRGFLTLHMPELNNYFTYRNIDVSSFLEACKVWYPDVLFNKPNSLHRVIPDLRDTISLFKKIKTLFL
jgi:oligoribonuclease